MQIVVRIILMLVIIFLVRLLRRWIRRLIFILILIVLAFFIYGIFNPSWASRLRYNVRTFPQRVTSRISSKTDFLDYDTYKLDTQSIWDKINLIDKNDEDLNLKGENDMFEKSDEELEDYERNDEISLDEDNESIKENYKDSEEIKDKDSTKKTDKNTIKSFPKNIKFIRLPEFEKEDEYEDTSDLTWYSTTDLLWVINKYIENNLDNDTDILVTVEYEDDNTNPKKIIFQTQPKNTWKWGSVYFSWISEEDLSIISNLEETSKNDNKDENEDINNTNEKDSNNNNSNDKNNNQTKTNSTNTQKKNTSSQKTTSNKLTEKEQKEAEEIYSILF